MAIYNFFIRRTIQTNSLVFSTDLLKSACEHSHNCEQSKIRDESSCKSNTEEDHVTHYMDSLSTKPVRQTGKDKCTDTLSQHE